MLAEHDAKNVIEILKEVIKANNELPSLTRDMERYNTKDGPNMSPNEMNKFRHIAASAYYVSKGYSETSVVMMGDLKEAQDFVKKLGWTDGSFDMTNNKKGREIGRKLKYRSQREIFNYIFKTEIEPYRKK